MKPQVKPQSKKLTQFIEELNTLQDKYQYKLVVQLRYSVSGIFPELSVADKVPPKKKDK